MHTAIGSGPRAIEAYTHACRASPLLGRQGRPGTGISLYSWDLKPTREVRIPQTRDVTMAVHLGGVRRVRVFTPAGVSRIFSRPGDITLIPRDCPIHYLIEGGVEFATLHLSADAKRFLGDDAERLLGLPHCLFALRDDYALASVRALLRASTATGHDAKRYTAKVLESLAWHLLRVVSETQAEPVCLADEDPSPAHRRRPADFAAVLAQIDHRLGERLALDELASMAGMGRTAFCERFSQQVGCTPHRYITRRRIEKARVLLQEERSSVTDVAYRLGFSSASHFSAAFKRATGASPQDCPGRRITS